MKKLLLGLGMVMTAVLLTACGGLDAFELLELSHEAEADIDSFVMEMTADISASVEGLSLDMQMTMSVEAESEDNSRTDMSMSIMGQSEETTIFVRDGNEYTEERIDGDVVERSRSGSNEDDSVDLEGADLIDFLSEDTVYESSATSMDDDGYRLEFVLNMDGVTSLLEELEFGDVVSDQSDESEDEDDEDEAGNVMVIYIDEDYLPISFEISLAEIDILLEGDEATISLDIELSVDQDVTIEFPEWLDVDPVAEADLSGIWSWDSVGLGSELLVFDRDLTGFLLTDTSTPGDAGYEDFTWRIVNDNHLYIFFDDNFGEADRYEITLENDVLTRVDLDTGIEDALFLAMSEEEYLEFITILEGESEVREFDLIGAWEQVEAEDENIIFFDIQGAGATLADISGNLMVEIFTWELLDGTLYLDIEGSSRVDRYTVVLEVDTLILTNVDSDNEYVFRFSMNLIEFTEFLEALYEEFQ